MNIKYEVHVGQDYVAVLAPADTTDNATAKFRDPGTARKFVTACNSHGQLVAALKALMAVRTVALNCPQPPEMRNDTRARFEAASAALIAAGVTV